MNRRFTVDNLGEACTIPRMSTLHLEDLTPAAREAVRAEARARGLTLQRITAKVPCFRCNGKGWFPSIAHGACFRCGGACTEDRNVTVLPAELAGLAQDAERAAYEAQLAEERRITAARKAELAAYSVTLRAQYGAELALLAELGDYRLVDAVNAETCTLPPDGFARDPSIRKAQAIIRSRAAAAARPACPGSAGREARKVRIVKRCTVEGQYGVTLRALVEGADGWQAWGTCPAGLAEDVTEATIVATWEAGQPGRFSRPKVAG